MDRLLNAIGKTLDFIGEMCADLSGSVVQLRENLHKLNDVTQIIKGTVEEHTERFDTVDTSINQLRAVTIGFDGKLDQLIDLVRNLNSASAETASRVKKRVQLLEDEAKRNGWRIHVVPGPSEE